MLDLFEPILKDYTDAEEGVTRGIRMNKHAKRKSTLMTSVKKLIIKITYG